MTEFENPIKWTTTIAVTINDQVVLVNAQVREANEDGEVVVLIKSYVNVLSSNELDGGYVTDLVEAHTTSNMESALDFIKDFSIQSAENFVIRNLKFLNLELW